MIAPPLVRFLILPLGAYVLGSTPFGLLIARAHGKDLRRSGSGNIGATNVARVVGRPWGYLCFFLDLAKGLIPTAAVGALLLTGADGPTLSDQAAWLAVGFGLIAGHVFSFWLRFHGGKGVATALGVVLGIYPYFTYAGLIAFAIWIVITLITRYVSLGSIVAALTFLPLFAAFNRPLLEYWPLGLFAAAMVALIIFRHRANISRLLAGTESKIGRSRPAPPSE